MCSCNVYFVCPYYVYLLLNLSLIHICKRYIRIWVKIPFVWHPDRGLQFLQIFKHHLGPGALTFRNFLNCICTIFGLKVPLNWYRHGFLRFYQNFDTLFGPGSPILKFIELNTILRFWLTFHLIWNLLVILQVTL